jgi:hypothetical protein
MLSAPSSSRLQCLGLLDLGVSTFFFFFVLDVEEVLDFEKVVAPDDDDDSDEVPFKFLFNSINCNHVIQFQ